MPQTKEISSLVSMDAPALVRRFGSPLYVYEASTIENQINKLKTAYGSANLKIKYAAKALTNISILKLMRKNGVGVEAVSLGEVFLATKAGFTPSEITFTPSGVEFNEIEEAVR